MKVNTRKPKWREAYEQEFQRLFLKLACTLKADRLADRCLYRWRVNTSCGVMYLHCLDDWVACKFAEPEKAKHCVDCNPCSGKWNFHTFWPQTTEGKAVPPDQFMEYVEQTILTIMLEGSYHK